MGIKNTPYVVAPQTTADAASLRETSVHSARYGSGSTASVRGMRRLARTPQAATVGQLAWQQHLAGQYDDLWSLVPQYYRPSYAEEKRR